MTDSPIQPTLLESYLLFELYGSSQDLNLSQKITKQGILLGYTVNSPKRGNLLLRSEYSGNPPTIIVYQQSIKNWKLNLEQQDILLSEEDLKEICIVHEYLHHIILHYSQYLPREIHPSLKHITRPQEEDLVRKIVMYWLFNRFPKYNIHHLSLILNG